MGKRTIEVIESATVSAENSTVHPAVAMVRISALVPVAAGGRLIPEASDDQQRAVNGRRQAQGGGEFSAKIDTSVTNVIMCSTAMEPRTGNAPTANGRATASRPPDTTPAPGS